MRTRLFRGFTLGMVVLLILAMLLPVAAVAADEPATNKDGAGAPLEGWVAIEPGQSHWYMFKYHFDNSKDDNVPPEALVILKAANDHCGAVNFVVQTDATLQLPKFDKDNKPYGPLGVGSPTGRRLHEHKMTPQLKADMLAADEHNMVLDRTNYVWSGSMRANETLYVIVKNSGTSTETYNLSITGQGVSF